VAYGELILGISGYAITLPAVQVPNAGYRAGKLNFVKPSQTPYGRATIRGPGYRPKLLLSCKIIADESTYLILYAHHEQQEAVRVTGANPSITIANGLRRISEYPPRTRAIVSGTSVTTGSNGALLYYPLWNGLITDLTYDLENETYMISVGFEETDLVPA
jgi:hypothetical protein